MRQGLEFDGPLDQQELIFPHAADRSDRIAGFMVSANKAQLPTFAQPGQLLVKIWVAGTDATPPDVDDWDRGLTEILFRPGKKAWQQAYQLARLLRSRGKAVMSDVLFDSLAIYPGNRHQIYLSN